MPPTTWVRAKNSERKAVRIFIKTLKFDQSTKNQATYLKKIHTSNQLFIPLATAHSFVAIELIYNVFYSITLCWEFNL